MISDLKVELPHTDLALNQQVFTYDSLKHIGNAVKTAPLNISLKDAKINLIDFKAFVPAFSHFDEGFKLSCRINGDLDNLKAETLASILMAWLPILKTRTNSRLMCLV